MEKLVSSITTLVNLVIVYLFITWSYQGLAFLARSFL